VQMLLRILGFCKDAGGLDHDLSAD
jgi:hypothetical protein